MYTWRKEENSLSHEVCGRSLWHPIPIGALAFLLGCGGKLRAQTRPQQVAFPSNVRSSYSLLSASLPSWIPWESVWLVFKLVAMRQRGRNAPASCPQVDHCGRHSTCFSGVLMDRKPHYLQ